MNFKNEIVNGDILLNIINGNITNLIKKENNVTYSISPLNNQEDYKFNITTVDIGDCENILRDKYNLDPNDFPAQIPLSPQSTDDPSFRQTHPPGQRNPCQTDWA